jgi:hypothetical protein
LFRGSSFAILLATIIGCVTTVDNLPPLQPVVVESVTPKGELVGRGTDFGREKTNQVLVVVPVQGLRAGTLLSYVRYLDGKYVDNRTAKLPGGLKIFVFRYAVKPGCKLVAGHYLYKIYIDRRIAGRAEFSITQTPANASNPAGG